MAVETDIGALLSKEMFVSGTQVNYFIICKTKLWLFSHFVTMEHSSDLVSYGKLVHETSYGEKKKEIPVALLFVLPERVKRSGERGR